MKNLLVNEVRNKFCKYGFNCVDAREIDIFFGYEEKYYASPRGGIYPLDKKSAKELSDKVFDIFKSMAGKFYAREEDYLKGQFESRENNLRFCEGKYETSYTYDWKPDYKTGCLACTTIEHNYLKVPYLYLKDGKGWGIGFYVHPSKEYVDLYLSYVGKVEELNSEKEGFFEYKSLSLDKEIKIPLVSKTGKKKREIFFPLSDFSNKARQTLFGVPPEQRHTILKLISDDIRQFGGFYNWTTGWRSEDISVERYNKFFKDRIS